MTAPDRAVFFGSANLQDCLELATNPIEFKLANCFCHTAQNTINSITFKLTWQPSAPKRNFLQPTMRFMHQSRCCIHTYRLLVVYLNGMLKMSVSTTKTRPLLFSGMMKATRLVKLHTEQIIL